MTVMAPLTRFCVFEFWVFTEATEISKDKQDYWEEKKHTEVALVVAIPDKYSIQLMTVGRSMMGS